MRRLKRLRFLGSKNRHLNFHHDCHATWTQITDETQNEDQILCLRSYNESTANVKTGYKKIHMDDLIMTAL